MTDREERQHVIEVLQKMVDWMEAAHYIVSKPERIHALFYAIASIKTDLKYDLLYEETSGQADKPTTPNDCETCIHNKGVLECDMYGCKYEPTTKNDLGVDCISRKAVINQIFYSTDNNGDVVLGSALRERIARLPSVTPLSSGLDKNSKKLKKDFGESDCIPRVKVIDYLCKHCPDDGECFKDCDEIKHLRQMSPVTPQESRIDFEELKRKILMEVDSGTDDAWLAYGEVCNRISNSIDEYIQSIKSMPGVTQQEPRWIPVSEKLPELITHKTLWGMEKKSDLVYITYRHNGKGQYCPIPCYYHSNGNWYTDRKSVEEWANLDEYDDLMDDALCCEVIAWMPLPKQYEPQESEGV